MGLFYTDGYKGCLKEPFGTYPCNKVVSSVPMDKGCLKEPFGTYPCNKVVSSVPVGTEGAQRDHLNGTYPCNKVLVSSCVLMGM